MNEQRRDPQDVGTLRKYLKKGDIIVIASLFAVSLLLGALSLLDGITTGRTYAVITRDGTETARLPLDEDRVYVISDGDVYNVIEIADGKARMTDARCPDRLCVSSGAVSRPGQVIVCLPDRVVVTVVSEDGGEVDSTAY